MNLYNQKYDVKIVCKEQVKIKNPKVGEICEHDVNVMKISFFQRRERLKNKYTKIELPKDFIIDLYNQINEIESNTIQKEYEKDLPF
jgi:hypothetical protein